MTDPIIEFNDFTFRYRAQSEPTLKNINLTIRPGEKILIIGPSGSGKSTLAHCINGLVPFMFPGEITGTYSVGGKDPKDLEIFGLSKIVGTVMQDTDGQFIGLTVAEDVAFALENDCVALNEMKDKVDEVAKAVFIDDLLESSPKELSGGQKQRVSMAGVMVDDVKIYLFDEPLANLDPKTGKNAIALIDDIQKRQNATIIIIEHRLEDALYREVDRIILINDGEIAADLKPDELLSTDLLDGAGIRYPLYVSALRHAGCKIMPDTHPSSITSMDITPYKDRFLDWFTSVNLPEKETETDIILSVKDLGFSYTKEKKVLTDISFDVRRGEMMSIVGKNGAGKSTLAGLICGFNTPGEGTILLNGKDISPLSIKERGEHIGYVMQNPNQMISKPMIFDEVALGLAVRGAQPDWIKEHVNNTLKTCGLYEMRNWPVSALSFGQKKRVTIASILVMSPQIIILDEPTAGQDYRHYTEFMEFLKKINEEHNVTIIMITHDMHLMLEYTNRAVVIADGHLIADDTPSRVLTNDDIADRACLKRTSLYDLAEKMGIDDASALADRFIYFERSSTDGRKSSVV